MRQPIKKTILFGAIIAFFIQSGFIFLQAAESESFEIIKQLENVITDTLSKRSWETEMGNYESATRYTDDIIKTLSWLEKAVMPLDKRIEKNLQGERDVLEQTIEKTDELLGDGDKDGDKRLFQSQKNNLTDTSDTVTVINKMLSDQLKTGNEGQSNSKDTILEEVSRLTRESSQFQSQALENIGRSSLTRAIPDMRAAIDRLEKALEKLKGNPSQNKEGQNSENNKNASNQRNPDASQNDGDKNAQEAGNKDEPRNDSTNSDELTSTEALKELSKLRKEMEDRKKQREKELGVVAAPTQIPVDKDW